MHRFLPVVGNFDFFVGDTPSTNVEVKDNHAFQAGDDNLFDALVFRMRQVLIPRLRVFKGHNESVREFVI